jgi:hypothetical protein
VTGAPPWVMDATRPGPVSLLDVVLEVCRYFGWSTEQVLDLPVRRFWLVVDHVRRRRQEMAQAAKANPLGALAMTGER